MQAVLVTGSVGAGRLTTAPELSAIVADSDAVADLIADLPAIVGALVRSVLRRAQCK